MKTSFVSNHRNLFQTSWENKKQTLDFHESCCYNFALEIRETISLLNHESIQKLSFNSYLFFFWIPFFFISLLYFIQFLSPCHLFIFIVVHFYCIPLRLTLLFTPDVTPDIREGSDSLSLKWIDEELFSVCKISHLSHTVLIQGGKLLGPIDRSLFSSSTIFRLL